MTSLIKMIFALFFCTCLATKEGQFSGKQTEVDLWPDYFKNMRFLEAESSVMGRLPEEVLKEIFSHFSFCALI